MGIFKDCGCGCGGAKAQQKFLISFMSALVFFIIANPDTFRLTRSIFGSWISGPTGCPTMRGLVFHTVVFMLVTWGMMNIKKEGYSMEMPLAPTETPEMIGPSAPPKMVDVPTPLPGFAEEQISFMDSGLELGSMDLMSEVDMPAPLEMPSKKAKTSCQCDDGSKLTIEA